MQTALRVPAKTIADNAGVEGAVIVGKLLESDETSDYGYNAAKGTPRYIGLTSAFCQCAK